MSVNKVFLLGNLGNTPELKTAKNGKPFCRLNLATNEKFTLPDGGALEKTTWHNVHVFGKQAEWACSNLQKGYRVFVEARIEMISESSENEKAQIRQMIRAFQVRSFNPLGPFAPQP